MAEPEGIRVDASLSISTKDSVSKEEEPPVALVTADAGGSLGDDQVKEAVPVTPDSSYEATNSSSSTSEAFRADTSDVPFDESGSTCSSENAGLEVDCISSGNLETENQDEQQQTELLIKEESTTMKNSENAVDPNDNISLPAINKEDTVAPSGSLCDEAMTGPSSDNLSDESTVEMTPPEPEKNGHVEAPSEVSDIETEEELAEAEQDPQYNSKDSPEESVSVSVSKLEETIIPPNLEITVDKMMEQSPELTSVNNVSESEQPSGRDVPEDPSEPSETPSSTPEFNEEEAFNKDEDMSEIEPQRGAKDQISDSEAGALVEDIEMESEVECRFTDHACGENEMEKLKECEPSPEDADAKDSMEATEIDAKKYEPTKEGQNADESTPNVIDADVSMEETNISKEEMEKKMSWVEIRQDLQKDEELDSEQESLPKEITSTDGIVPTETAIDATIKGKSGPLSVAPEQSKTNSIDKSCLTEDQPELEVESQIIEDERKDNGTPSNNKTRNEENNVLNTEKSLLDADDNISEESSDDSALSPSPKSADVEQSRLEPQPDHELMNSKEQPKAQEPDGDCEFLNRTLISDAMPNAEEVIVLEEEQDAPGKVVTKSRDYLLKVKDCASSALSTNSSSSYSAEDNLTGFATPEGSANEDEPSFDDHNLNTSSASLTSFISAEASWNGTELVYDKPTGNSSSKVTHNEQPLKALEYNAPYKLPQGSVPNVRPSSLPRYMPSMRPSSPNAFVGSDRRSNLHSPALQNAISLCRQAKKNSEDSPIARLRYRADNSSEESEEMTTDSSLDRHYDSASIGGLKKPNTNSLTIQRPKPRVSFAAAHRGPHYEINERVIAPRLFQGGSYKYHQPTPSDPSQNQTQSRRSTFAAYLRKRLIDDEDNSCLGDNDSFCCEDYSTQRNPDGVPKVLNPTCNSVESSFTTMISKGDTVDEGDVDTIFSALDVASKTREQDGNESDESSSSDTEYTADEETRSLLTFLPSFFGEADTTRDDNTVEPNTCEEWALPSVGRLEDFIMTAASDFGLVGSTKKVTNHPHSSERDDLSDFVDEIENEERLEGGYNDDRSEDLTSAVFTKEDPSTQRHFDADLSTAASRDRQDCGIITFEDIHEFAVMAAQIIETSTREVSKQTKRSLAIKARNQEQDIEPEAFEHTVDDMESVKSQSQCSSTISKKTNARIAAKLEHIKKTQPQVYKVFLAKIAAAEKAGRKFDFRHGARDENDVEETAQTAKNSLDDFEDSPAKGSSPASAPLTPTPAASQPKSGTKHGGLVSDWETFGDSPFKEPLNESFSGQDDGSVFDDFQWLNSATDTLKDSFTSTMERFLGPQTCNPKDKLSQYNKKHPTFNRVIAAKFAERESMQWLEKRSSDLETAYSASDTAVTSASAGTSTDQLPRVPLPEEALGKNKQNTAPCKEPRGSDCNSGRDDLPKTPKDSIDFKKEFMDGEATLSSKVSEIMPITTGTAADQEARSQLKESAQLPEPSGSPKETMSTSIPLAHPTSKGDQVDPVTAKTKVPSNGESKAVSFQETGPIQSPRCDTILNDKSNRIDEEIDSKKLFSKKLAFFAKKKSTVAIAKAQAAARGTTDAHKKVTSSGSSGISEAFQDGSMDREDNLVSTVLQEASDRSKTPLSSNRTGGKVLRKPASDKKSNEGRSSTPLKFHRSIQSTNSAAPMMTESKSVNSMNSRLTVQSSTASSSRKGRSNQVSSDSSTASSTSQWEDFDGSKFKDFVVQSFSAGPKEMGKKTKETEGKALNYFVRKTSEDQPEIDLEEASFLDAILPASPSFPSNPEVHEQQDPWDFTEVANAQWEHFSPLSFDSSYANWGLKEKRARARAASKASYQKNARKPGQRPQPNVASPSSIAEF